MKNSPVRDNHRFDMSFHY